MNIAMIPARSGSKRIPRKNTKVIAGKPLICHTIEQALLAPEIDKVLVSTDCVETAHIAVSCGAEVPTLRPKEFASDASPDIEWVRHAFQSWLSAYPVGLVCILRPTSPLRTARTIGKAVQLISSTSWADSVRAMEKVKQHPGKMWRLASSGDEAFPFSYGKIGDVPQHSMPTQSLEPLWIQNASLEVARYKSIVESGKISGNRVLSFEVPGLEGYDLNTLDDWLFLEALIERQDPRLPAHILDTGYREH